MENGMAYFRRAAGQTALIRWVALAASAVMLLGIAPLPVIALGIAFVAAYNGALQFASASPDRFPRWGYPLCLLASAADILVLSVTIGAYQAELPGFYLLYTLAILAVGHVFMKPRYIGATLAGSLIGNFVATLMARKGLTGAILMLNVVRPAVALAAAAGVSVALTVFKKRDDNLQRRDKKLSTLLEFGTRFASGADAARVMEQTLRAAIHNTDASAGYIMLVNEDGDRRELRTEVAVSLGEERSLPTARGWGEGLEGYVAETGKMLSLARATPKRGQTAPTEEAFRYDAEAALCIPLTEDDPNAQQTNVIGILTLLNHAPDHPFLDDDVDLARTLAGLVTMAVVNSRLYEDLRISFMRSLHALAKTLESRDAYTQGHSFRVSELCVMIAQKLHVAPEIVENLRNGALLHDVGKIGIPDAILCKPSRLTDEEFEIMQQHPVIGYEICKPLGLSDEILMLIRNHHEKLDGSGYPDGLKLGELPLPLRIICVADAFDAMSSSRPYRKAMDSELRTAQLNRFAGIQFDPVVVETLKGIDAAGLLDELYRDHWEPKEKPVLEPENAPPTLNGIAESLRQLPEAA